MTILEGESVDERRLSAKGIVASKREGDTCGYA